MPTREVLADVPAASLDDDAPLLRPAPRRPADLAARRPTTRRPRAASTRRRRCGADLLAPARRHLVGVVAVRPPALPQHGRGPGRRRRRAAAQAPGHRRDTGRGWPSPPTATTAGARSTRAPAPPLSWPRRCCNLACVGARPLALVNCLNFGNPEHPEVMWQLSEAIDGMAEACRALGLPGGRRQRQPLQREPRRATSTRRRSSACWARSTTSASPSRREAGRRGAPGALRRRPGG